MAVEDYFTVLMCFEALWLDVHGWGYAMRYVASSFCFQPISENNHFNKKGLFVDVVNVVDVVVVTL